MFYLMFKECGPNADKPSPLIICGDFNLPSGCPIYNFLLGHPLLLAKFCNARLVDQYAKHSRHSSYDIISEKLKIGQNCCFFENIGLLILLIILMLPIICL